MPVDSLKYLPRVIAAYYKLTAGQPEVPIPWTPLDRPLNQCTVGLVTTGGLYQCGAEPAFDVEREKEEPSWGDPTYRTLPADLTQREIGVSHLHINTRDVLQDANILLPLDRLRELVREGLVGAMSARAYSFMGYQGFPSDTTAWRQTFAPEVADRLRTQGANCVLLTPA